MCHVHREVRINFSASETLSPRVLKLLYTSDSHKQGQRTMVKSYHNPITHTKHVH